MSPTAADILRGTAETYAACATYRDTGEVVSVFTQETPRARRQTDIQPFSTWFVRPDRLRFEFRDRQDGPEEEWPLYVAWKNARGVYRWRSLRPGKPEAETLHGALAGGISGEPGRAVPALLLPEEVGGGRLTDRGATLEGEETVDGLPCWRLDLREKRGSRFAIWIDQRTFLLRRMFERREFTEEVLRKLRSAIQEMSARLPAASAAQIQAPRDDTEPFTLEQTTTYAPELDADIHPAVFEFTPPA